MAPAPVRERTRRSTTQSERQAIVALAHSGQSDPQIAAQLGWSVATVRKWRRRARTDPTLASRRGRPPQSGFRAYGSRAAALRQQLRTWRAAHPGWGPKTLRAELARHPDWGHGLLPSGATLARFLKAEGWIAAPKRKQVEAAHPTRPAPQQPHEAWQLDARGASEIPTLGVVALVHLNDGCSHARLLSYPFPLGPGPAGGRHRHLTCEDYQLALRLAFCDWGLPDRLQVDHETVFCDPDSTTPFPTRFHLWLLALGVELCFSRVHRPTDQGLTERSHQLWEAQVLRGQTFATRAALVHALRERRGFLNEHLPCRSLGERPPLVAYPEARQPRRPYRPEQECQLLEPQRIARYLDGKTWHRKISNARTFRIGNQVYRLGRGWTAGSTAIIQHTAAAPGAGCFRVRSEVDALEREFPVRNCAPEELMGDLTRLLQVPGYQPALPFSWEEERVIRLCETLTGTNS